MFRVENRTDTLATNAAMKCSSAQEAVDFILARQLIPITFVEDLGGDLSRFPSGEDVIDELVRGGRMTEYQQAQLLSGQGDKLCFGQYRLIKPLGQGGMGQVFKAWQPRLDRFVALKFIQKEFLDSQSNALVRFQRESHAIGQLQHPNIIVLYDADEIDGVPFIALEFVDGMSLSDMVSRNGLLGVKQACEYMRQTALGLQHAFECGFVHRDIKPSNIVVSQSSKKANSATQKRLSLITTHDRKRQSDNDAPWDLDRIKILDMGLARLTSSLTSGNGMVTLTESGAMLGTPDFLAPEQARDASKVDIRADLYSLGCTFYFVLSGQPPFPGGTSLEKVIRHQCDLPTPIRTLRRDLPECVARTVEKLLAKNPDDRFQTPWELAKALGQHLATAHYEPAVAPRPRGSKSGTLPTLIAPQQASAAKTVAASTDFGRSTNQDSILVLPAENSPGVWKTMMPVDQADAVKPEMKDLNRATMADSTAKPMRTAKIKPVAKLEGHNGAVSGLAVARDGTMAATADVNGQIRIWNLHDSNPREIDRRNIRSEIQAIAFAPHDLNYAVFGEVREGKAGLVCWDWKLDSFVGWGNLAPLGQKHFGCLSFSADGKLLAAGLGSLAVVWKVEVGAATNRKVFKGMDKSIRAIAVSPDCQQLAAAGQDMALHFWHLGGGKWDRTGIRVNSHIATVTTMQYSPDGSTLALAGLDNRIALFPMADDSVDAVRILQGHTSNVQRIQFIGDGTQLASIGVDGQVLYWDIKKASIVRERQLDLALAYRVEMSVDGTRLVAGFSNGLVGVYSLNGPG